MPDSPSNAALITKHDFLTKLEEHCRSSEGLAALRALFAQPKVEETLRYFERQDLLTGDEAKLVRGAWLARGGAFPQILERTETAFRDALDRVRTDGPQLSAWIVIGATSRYDARVLSGETEVLLLILVPRLPEPPPDPQCSEGPFAKLTADPGFGKHLGAISDLLARLGFQRS